MALEKQRKGSHSWWSWRGRDALCKTILYSAADVPSFWWPAQLQNHASPYHNILRSYFISASTFWWTHAPSLTFSASLSNWAIFHKLSPRCPDHFLAQSVRLRVCITPSAQCYHQCKAVSPSLSGEMPSFFAQIETRLYNMLAIHKLSPTRLCSGLVHVFFLVLLLCLFSVGHYLATKKRGRKKKILWVSLTCILSVGLFEGKANCYASEVHC